MATPATAASPEDLRVARRFSRKRLKALVAWAAERPGDPIAQAAAGHAQAMLDGAAPAAWREHAIAILQAAGEWQIGALREVQAALPRKRHRGPWGAVRRGLRSLRARL